MESLGLGELLHHRNLHPGQDPISIYTILSELKRDSEAWKRECKGLEEKGKQTEEGMKKEGQIGAQLREELGEQLAQNERLIEELEKMQEQQRGERERAKGLEEEKN